MALALAGCDLPRDPEHTLERVRGGTLRAGVTENEPWVRLPEDGPSGVEVALVERFAEELGAQVEWVEGSEAELMEAMHRRELDLVIGGLAADTPWQEKASITRPYLVTRTVVGVPQGQPAPETEHVMAVPLGENGWQVRLERFLSANRPLVTDLLEQEGHP